MAKHKQGDVFEVVHVGRTMALERGKRASASDEGQFTAEPIGPQR